MDASHVALLALTGSPVIGVFQTLSAGKAGQRVPGRTCRATLACTHDVPTGFPTAMALLGTTLSAVKVTAPRSNEAPRRKTMKRASGAMHPFYLVAPWEAEDCPRVVATHSIDD
jgi:hypothetical protein